MLVQQYSESNSDSTNQEIRIVFLPVVGDEFNDSILTTLKGAVPKVRFDPSAEEGAPEVQDRDKRSKLPLWSVVCSYEHDNDFEPENFEVRIACDGDPGIVPGPIRFGGLAVRTWNMNGKKGVSFSADTWTQEPRPSTKRPAKPDTPPTSAAAVKGGQAAA